MYRLTRLAKVLVGGRQCRAEWNDGLMVRLPAMFHDVQFRSIQLEKSG